MPYPAELRLIGAIPTSAFTMLFWIAMTLPSTKGGSLRGGVEGADRALVSGIAWTVVFRWVSQIISWTATLYVARVLKPGDYGLVAMATVPIGLARLVEDMGLDAIILQDRTLDKEQLTSLAGTILCLGGALTLSFMALSTPIAAYFRQAAVRPLVLVLSLTFITDAVQVLPRALLQRELRFRTLAWLHGLQVTVAGVVVAVGAALALGYWALVLNTLVSSTVVTIVLYALHPYAVTWPRQLDRIARPLIAGWRILVARAAWYGYTSLDSVLIGRVLGKDALGAFGFAMTFASLPITEVSQMVSKVIPGVFTSVQDSTVQLRRYFLVLTQALSYLTLPMSFGLLLTADDVVFLALGPAWQAVILPLRILSLYISASACQMLIGHILLWTGHFRANMWLNILTVLTMAICFYVGVHWGVAGVAWAWAVGFPLTILPALPVLCRILDLRLSNYVDALRPALTACLGMSLLVLFARHELPVGWNHGARLAAQAGVGAMFYTLILLTIYRPRIVSIYDILWRSRPA